MLLIGVKLRTSQMHLMAGIIQNKLVTFLDSYKHIRSLNAIVFSGIL